MPVRKINYYNLSLASGENIHQRLADIADWVNEQNESRSDHRKLETSTRAISQITNFALRYNDTYNCCMKLILEEFPEVIDKVSDDIEELAEESDPTKGLYEETHFVIYLRPNNEPPVLAIESVMKGAKTRDVENFLNVGMVKAGFNNDTLRFDPVFAFQYENFEARIEDVANLKMMFHYSDIAAFTQYDATAGELLRLAQNYADTEYVTLEFKVNFQRTERRHNTDDLKSRVLNFVRIFRRNPEAKRLVKKLDVRAQDKQAEGKIRLFDLIEEKVASEITVEKKRPTSQYYLSNDMYNAIRSRIRSDFRDNSEEAG